jgi:hypothetical protein
MIEVKHDRELEFYDLRLAPKVMTDIDAINTMLLRWTTATQEELDALGMGEYADLKRRMCNLVEQKIADAIRMYRPTEPVQ